MAEDLFCKMVAGEIPVDKVYEDEDILAFRDIRPQAPTHILIIPKKHIAMLADATEKDEELLGKLLFAASKIAKQEGIAESGYRVVINNGPDSGQEVYHIHIHLLGGRKLGWPPG
ncbi:MAG: histidine triad nucleotide-binding protein [Firmicutes bacterium]|nr:histidine triad nucleotide-binding protein [Bacillota bacterium]